MKWLKGHRIIWAVVGGMLSIGAPLGLWAITFLLPDTILEFQDLAYLYSGIGTFLVFSSFGYVLGGFIEKIERLSRIDGLTHLSNRRYLMERLQEELDLSRRYPQHFSLIMADLDHFKQVNDRFGHLVGDQTLKAVSQVIRNECRSTDIPGRYGGEEFLIICPNTSEMEAYHLAERIRKTVAHLPPNSLGYNGSQTISLGIVALPPSANVMKDLLLQNVDSALYQAKAQGRNQSVIGTE